jgi:hypothetical protein
MGRAVSAVYAARQSRPQTTPPRQAHELTHTARCLGCCQTEKSRIKLDFIAPPFAGYVNVQALQLFSLDATRSRL